MIEAGAPQARVFFVRAANTGLMLDVARNSDKYETESCFVLTGCVMFVRSANKGFRFDTIFGMKSLRALFGFRSG